MGGWFHEFLSSNTEATKDPDEDLDEFTRLKKLAARQVQEIRYDPAGQVCIPITSFDLSASLTMMQEDDFRKGRSIRGLLGVRGASVGPAFGEDPGNVSALNAANTSAEDF